MVFDICLYFMIQRCIFLYIDFCAHAYEDVISASSWSFEYLSHTHTVFLVHTVFIGV